MGVNPHSDRTLPLKRIISGGQTGVDRAALDVARELGLQQGGWCPAGRKAEDGIIPTHYLLQETTSDQYAVRTRLNVRDSDGTLILTSGPPSGGTALTIEFAKSLDVPHLVLDLHANLFDGLLEDWLAHHKIRVLNVAGPRESTSPGIHQQAYEKLIAWLNPLVSSGSPQILE